MLSTIFNKFLYEPMLNILIWLYNVLGSFGLAVIVLTVLIRLLTNPLNRKALESQKVMNVLQPKIKEIQKKYKGKEKQAEEMIKLYKEHKFNPFSSLGLLFVQLPIIIALFQVFKIGLDLSQISSSIYPFIALPTVIDSYFLGINLAAPNIYLAGITAIVQFFQAKTAMPAAPKQENNKEQDQMMQVSNIVQKQMIFFLPVITFFVLFRLPSAIALYWSITNIFSIVQQKNLEKKHDQPRGDKKDN